MKPRFDFQLRHFLTVTLVLAGTARHAVAAVNTYQWNGTTDTSWATATNWTTPPGVGATASSSDSRLSVYNGTGQALVYSAVEGSTVYANTTGRGLVISSATGVIAGSMTITGGSFSTLGSTTEDVIGNAAAGTLTISGGSFIGAGPGSFLGLNSQNISGVSVLGLSGAGSATFTTLKMAGYQATVNLDGGNLVANQIVDIDDQGAPGNSDTTFNFNGGTLTAGSGAVTAFMTGLSRARVLAGGAFIDSNGMDITIGQALLAPTTGASGGLTKNGAGTLTLAGINTYTGDTTVSNGSLVLAAGSRLQFVVTDAPAANQVSGSGTAVFNGEFGIDTTGVSGATGHIWLLVDRAALTGESFDDATFSVIGFTDPENDGTWVMSDAKGDWSFSEGTGELTLDIGSDYDDWTTANGVLGGENDDDDNDGLSNFEEYAFGLDPTGGSSVNPIASPLDKATGKFSYTRRDTGLTDLAYSVWFSEDLINWTQDTDAAEGVPALSGEVETVEVTLSALAGDPLPAKLFIQVRAN